MNNLQNLRDAESYKEYKGDYVPPKDVGYDMNFEDERRNSKFDEEAEQGAMMIKEIFGKRDHQPRSSFIQLRSKDMNI